MNGSCSLISQQNSVRAFYNGLGQRYSIYSYEVIAQSPFHEKTLFVNNC